MSNPRLIQSSAAGRPACMAAVIALLACAACTPPPDSPTEKPVEPQASGLRDAIQQPLDTARGTQATLDANAARQRQAIDDAGG